MTHIMRKVRLICAFSAAFMITSCGYGLRSETSKPATAIATLAPPTTTVVVNENNEGRETPRVDSVNNNSPTIKPTHTPAATAAIENNIIRASQAEGSFDGGLAISANGRYITFVSDTINPVSENQCVGFTGDPQACTQVYVFDRVSNSVQLVSAATGGTPGNGHSGTWPEAGHHTSISDDGRFIAFASGATNLTPDLSKCTLFVHDRVRKETECVGRTANMEATSWYPTLSADGRYVAFNSTADDLVANDTNDLWDVFVYDRQTGEMERVSVASDDSEGNNVSGHWFAPDISADGRFVVFVSWASNLVSDDANDVSDIFIYDRETNQTKMVSVSHTGLPANGPSVNAVISANGQFVAFESEANNLVPDDTNNVSDIFVYDLQTATLKRVSLSEGGEQSNGLSRTPSISANGRFITFASRARNLVAGDTNLKEDVFVYDRQMGQIKRVSVTELGADSNGHSKAPEISVDGNWIGFVSEADNLVSDDFNQTWDVFVLELTNLFSVTPNDMPITATSPTASPLPTTEISQTAILPILQGGVEWVSRATDGSPGNGSSEAPSLSADGRFVAFTSRASNLVPGDSDSDCADDAFDLPRFSCSDIFVYDRLTSKMERVSVASDGTPGNSESGGRQEAGSLTSISADGRFVAFQSHAWNLVPGCSGVYVHDRQTRETRCISKAYDGTPSNGASSWPVISANGRFVVFVSDADNLVPGDTNGFNDYFVHDLQTGQTERVSVASNGTQANNYNSDLVGIASLSADGRFVAFSSYANNLVANDTNDGERYGVSFVTPDMFVHDRQTGITERISVASDGTEGNGGSFGPSISADGRFVAFASQASNLVPDDTNRLQDVFVHDRQTGQTTRVSISTEGNQAKQGESSHPTISADGRWIAFISDATNLVPHDTNGAHDIFVHDRQTGQTVRVSLTEDNQEANGDSFQPALSADGCTIAFVSLASNLMSNDSNKGLDVFVRDLRPLCLTDG